MSEYRLKIAVFEATRSVCPQNFRYKGTSPTNHSSCQKTRCTSLSYGIRMSAELSLVLSQDTRVTDRQTDGQTDGSTMTHGIFMPLHGNNIVKVSNLQKAVFFVVFVAVEIGLPTRVPL